MTEISDELIEIEGFHGTSYENGTKILEEGFKSSESDEDWLGDGVYFFVEGIPPAPQNNAVKWAIVSAWDNQIKCNKYSIYTVIKGEIEVKEDKFLDLTEYDGIKLFNYLRNKFITKIANSGKKIKNGAFRDGHIINEARNEVGMKIDVVKGNFYIKFQKERIYDINFRTPNSTILAVQNKSSIKKDSLSIYKTEHF